MDEKRTGYISIGEMAKMNRTTVPTLRLYDSMNLLTPCYVDEKTCYRYYDIKQNARLDMIQYMKELGMELKEIKSILDRKDLDLIEDVLMQKKEQTLQEMQELKFKMEAIDRTVASIKRYKKYVVGLDLGGTKIYTALVDLNGTIIKEKVVETLAFEGEEAVINRMMDTIDYVIEGTDKELIKAIGIGAPGAL